MNEEDLLEKAFNSISPLQPARPRPEVLAGLRQKLAHSSGRIVQMPRQRARLLIAGAVLLLFGNISIIFSLSTGDPVVSNPVDAVAYEESSSSLIESYNFFE